MLLLQFSVFFWFSAQLFFIRARFSTLCHLQSSIDSVDDRVDAKKNLISSPSADWKRTLGHPQITWSKTAQNDLDSHKLTWTEVVNLAQKWRPLEAVKRQRFYVLTALHAGDDDVCVGMFQCFSWTIALSCSARGYQYQCN